MGLCEPKDIASHIRGSLWSIAYVDGPGILFLQTNAYDLMLKGTLHGWPKFKFVRITLQVSFDGFDNCFH